MLNETESNELEGRLTFVEACEALKNMKNNKSPDQDGFTVEFLKIFLNDIGYFLVRSINEGFSKQCLSFTQRQGVIICLPKERKPKQFLKNWRPISLLYVSYKIALHQLLQPELNKCFKIRMCSDSNQTVLIHYQVADVRLLIWVLKSSRYMYTLCYLCWSSFLCIL